MKHNYTQQMNCMFLNLLHNLSLFVYSALFALMILSLFDIFAVTKEVGFTIRNINYGSSELGNLWSEQLCMKEEHTSA